MTTRIRKPTFSIPQNREKQRIRAVSLLARAQREFVDQNTLLPLMEKIALNLLQQPRWEMLFAEQDENLDAAWNGLDLFNRSCTAMWELCKAFDYAHLHATRRSRLRPDENKLPKALGLLQQVLELRTVLTPQEEVAVDKAITALTQEMHRFDSVETGLTRLYFSGMQFDVLNHLRWFLLAQEPFGYTGRNYGPFDPHAKEIARRNGWPR
ncbi:hypothetical protein AB4142_26675 [Variovorax sp. 2RAF20]